MASEWDGFLEGLADELAEAYIADQGYEQAEFPNLSRVADKLLKKRLKPLLEAGQAMRQTYPYYGGPKATWTCKEAWDAAREAAQKAST